MCITWLKISDTKSALCQNIFHKSNMIDYLTQSCESGSKTDRTLDNESENVIQDLNDLHHELYLRIFSRLWFSFILDASW